MNGCVVVSIRDNLRGNVFLKRNNKLEEMKTEMEKEHFPSEIMIVIICFQAEQGDITDSAHPVYICPASYSSPPFRLG